MVYRGTTVRYAPGVCGNIDILHVYKVKYRYSCVVLPFVRPIHALTQEPGKNMKLHHCGQL